MFMISMFWLIETFDDASLVCFAGALSGGEETLGRGQYGRALFIEGGALQPKPLSYKEMESFFLNPCWYAFWIA